MILLALLKRAVFPLMGLCLLALFIDVGKPSSEPIAQTSQKVQKKRSFKPNVDLQGHRGSRGLMPENTWPAFVAALEHGMTTLELDLNLTADNNLIVYHDFKMNARLCKLPDGARVDDVAVQKLTVDELKTYDCGISNQENWPQQKEVSNIRLLTLREFFVKIGDYEAKRKPAVLPHFNLELKLRKRKHTRTQVREAARLTVAEVERAGMQARSSVQSFHLDVLPLIKEYNPKLPTGALFHKNKKRSRMVRQGRLAEVQLAILADAAAVRADVVNVHHRLATPEFIELAQKRGFKLMVWTVNDKYEMHRFLNMGVDGIITDYPNNLKLTWNVWSEVNQIGEPPSRGLQFTEKATEMFNDTSIPKTTEARSLYLYVLSQLTQ